MQGEGESTDHIPQVGPTSYRLEAGGLWQTHIPQLYKNPLPISCKG